MGSVQDVGLREQIAHAQHQLEELEQLLGNAYRDLLVRNFGPEWGNDQFARHQRDFAWHLKRDFFDPYQSKGFYPIERLPKATYWLLDLVLQHHLLVNCMFPIQNSVVFGSNNFSLSKPRENLVAYLNHICLTQATIGQVRVLWERLMGFVYYLETGKELHKKGSAKRAFFREIDNWEGRWDPLKEWSSELIWYDDNFRTPEFHKNSKIRAGIFKDTLPDPNSVITLLSPINGGFWPMLVANIQGVQLPTFRLGRSAETDQRMEDCRPASDNPSKSI